MGVLSSLEPNGVFKYFEELCQIPHGSGNCKQISDYLVQFAKDHNLQWQQDEMLNVIMIKEASEGYENVAPVILQGHMDMVAVKEPDCDIDMEKEPLRLRVDGDFISADGTSLGGDDGIAVAYALAILDDDSIKHPKLEVIITTEEEVGMEGATALDASICQGRKLLNLDSEEEGILLSSCAGGCRAHTEVPVARENVTGDLYELRFAKMLGGHSGAEIDKEHGNAIKFIGRALRMLRQDVDFNVYTLEGGEKDNAIACDSFAQLVIKATDADKLQNAVKKVQETFKAEYATKEPSMEIILQKKGSDTYNALTKVDSAKVADYLFVLPNGIQNMSVDMKGLVETSLNVGIMRLLEDKITTDSAIRSSIATAKQALKEQVQVICELYGGEVTYHGEYPGWQFDPNSALRQDMVKLYEEMFGQTPQVVAIHAGLECGILCEKLPGLDCVSFGPNMYDIHTTEERLSISSTKRMWDYVIKLLEKK